MNIWQYTTCGILVLVSISPSISWAKAKPKIEKPEVQAFLEEAERCGGAEGVNAAIAAIYGRTELHYAALYNDIFSVRLLLADEKSTINATDRAGATPLALAAEYGSLQAVKLLLNAGANGAIADKEGRTALDKAQENNHHLIVDLLQ